MKKLFILVLVFIVGCTEKDIIEKSTISYLNIEKEQIEVEPIDVVTINDIDYASVNDLRAQLSKRQISDEFVYSEMSERYDDEDYVIYTVDGSSITIKKDGTIIYDYVSTVESEYLGFIETGNLLDLYKKELGIVKVLTSIDYQEKELVEGNYQKSIDLNTFDVEPIFDEEVFIPVHLLSFLFNGFSHLNFSIVGDELVFFDYVNQADKVYMNDLTFNKDIKNYFIGYFKYIFTEFNFSYGIYSETYNSYKEEAFSKMKKAKNYEDFYSAFNELLYKLEDYHLYVKKYGQSYEEFSSNYGALATKHREEGNLPKYYSANDFRYKVQDDTLIFTLDTFWDDYSSEMESLIKEYNPSNIILDIRNNPGGQATYLYNTLSLFTNRFSFNAKDFNDNKLSLTHRFYDTFYFKGELYILTSELSFSTATWLSSIVKTNNIGTLIGEKTLGGHTSTIPVLMPDGSILNMAIAVAAIVDDNFDYIENGVEPDIYIKDEYVNGDDMIMKKALESLE